MPPATIKMTPLTFHAFQSINISSPSPLKSAYEYQFLSPPTSHDSFHLSILFASCLFLPLFIFLLSFIVYHFVWEEIAGTLCLLALVPFTHTSRKLAVTLTAKSNNVIFSCSIYQWFPNDGRFHKGSSKTAFLSNDWKAIKNKNEKAAKLQGITDQQRLLQ